MHLGHTRRLLFNMQILTVQIDVLKEIGCIDDDLVVQLKGRVACEMNSGEELICTECLFENQLNDLEPEEAVAIMSAFVFQQRNTSEPSFTPRLSQAKNRYTILSTINYLHFSIEGNLLFFLFSYHFSYMFISAIAYISCIIIRCHLLSIDARVKRVCIIPRSCCRLSSRFKGAKNISISYLYYIFP